MLRRLRCRALGHRRRYYTPEDHPHDLWLGCVRCKDPETVVDKVEWHDDPNHPGWGYVDMAALERMKGWLNGVASG